MYKIIVSDTSPLITLAVANELDVLLIPKIPIQIPDAVYIEATRIKDAPGANLIGDWINRNTDMVRVVFTQTGIDQINRLEQHRPIRGMGETAAIETLTIFSQLHPHDRALLIFEDIDVAKRLAVLGDNASIISTGELLRVLELERRIPSAERILDKAAATGRTVEKLRQDSLQNASDRQELREQLQTMR